MNRLVALTLAALICVCPSAKAEDFSSHEAEVKKTLAAFIQAFDNLDWETFRAAFADDATVFYPRGFPQRANGRPEFERNFRLVFEQIHGGRTKGPYMDLQPRDVNIQLAGDIAIVTFHLDDRAGFVNRRTVILRKFSEDWKIIHLHASEVSIPAP
jgi:ketosteroid isomerase-like protein